MDFTTPLFLFILLPIILGSYWISPISFRPVLLLATSLLLYLFSDGEYFYLLCLSIFINYIFSLLIDRCKEGSLRLSLLWGAIALNLLGLMLFKYPEIIRWSGVSKSSVHLPLGISFFTFQAIAWIIDLYNRKHTAALNPLKLSLFLSIFPKISAGPIIRYEEVSDSISRPAVDMESCGYGAKRFIIGLGKKLLIADTLARTADQIFAIPGNELSAPLAWLGIICYTLQLYYDFSGYSDMAIGLGRMLGFSFRENFDYPYIAKSLTEFWRRWHISLSTWFRDYLYTPLVYTLMTEKIREKIAARQYPTNYRSMFSIVVVFTLCGWWHGSTWNFVLWGLLHGLLLALESWKLGKILKKAPAPVAHIYTLLVLMLCWVFFRSPTLVFSLGFITALLGLGSGNGVLYSCSRYLNNELLLVLALAIAGSTPVARVLRERLNARLPVMSATLIETGAVTVILLLSLVTVANSTYKPFIYFNF